MGHPPVFPSSNPKQGKMFIFPNNICCNVFFLIPSDIFFCFHRNHWSKEKNVAVQTILAFIQSLLNSHEVHKAQSKVQIIWFGGEWSVWNCLDQEKNVSFNIKVWRVFTILHGQWSFTSLEDIFDYRNRNNAILLTRVLLKGVLRK